MKRSVYKIQKSGPINNLKITDENLIPPLSDEITIQIKAIGLNFADVFSIQGLYKAAPKENFTPGLEFSGIVVNKGNNVSEFEIDDKVIGVTKFGAFATHININRNYLIKLPQDWTFEEGSGFIVQALTAYYAIKELGNIQNGQTVLIHSIAGGVGIYANRIAKKFNCKTIGTVGNKNKIEQIQDEGIDNILVRDDNFITNLKKILGNDKLDLIMESLTGKYFKQTFNLLAPQGRVIVYGASNFATHSAFPNYFQLAYKYFTRPKIDILPLIEQNKSIMAFNLIWLYEKGEYLKKQLNEILNLNLRKPLVGGIFEFDKLPAAIRRFQSGKTIGKVVIKLST